MIYLTQMLGKPVLDATGEEIGTINDVAIATREIFPRVTALAFVGPGKTPFLLSWRKFVEEFDGESVKLNAARPQLRFSYLQPDEVLLARDLLNKQIVDTQGMKVVRVNDLKLAESKNQMRLLGAEVGVRGILRGISPSLERGAQAVLKVFGTRVPERLIAWNYMDLLDRDLSHVQLSVTHKRLHELHPADVADILEQLSPSQRAKVFDHLENPQAAEALSEMEDEYQAQVVGDLTNQRASDILEMMDPDDAADILGDLPYDKAETLLRLMGVKESREIQALLGYKEKTAGGIMTTDVATVTPETRVGDAIDYLRSQALEHENVYDVYVADEDRNLIGVVGLRELIVSPTDTPVSEVLHRDVATVDANDDQEEVADIIAKYDLLSVPVTDETGKLLGIVTVDDAMDVLEEESAEDLALATGARPWVEATGVWRWLGSKSAWLIVWLVLGLGGMLVVRAFSELLSTFVAAAFFIPLVLRLSEEISSHSLSALIEASPEERPSFLRQLVLDSGIGAGLGLVSGLIVFALLELIQASPETAVTLAASVALAVLAVALLAAVLPYVALQPGGAGWRAPSALITSSIAAAGVALYLLFAAVLRGLVRI